MAEPTLADLLKAMETLTADVTAMKADMASMKAQSSSSSGSGDDRRAEGLRDQEFHPKHKKWDFPRFDGSSDPMLFLNKCEAYFRQHRTMAEERVLMASYHLDDVAQLWFTQLQDDDGTPSWGNFKDLLNLRFGPPLRSAPMFELAECRRTGTVEEYSNRFQALLPRAGRLEEAQRVQLYTGGLLPPLSHAVRLHHPETLAAAMSLARQVELMEQSRPAPTLYRAPQRGLLAAPAPRPALPASPQPLALPAPLAANQQGRAEGTIRRLSKDEMAERRRQGLCFNCNEPYTRGHNRFCKRLFFVDGVEVDDVEDAAEAGDQAAGTDAPCYSLHAVAGVRLSDTLRVRVMVGSVSLVALSDSGSSHNFISERAAQRTGLLVVSRPRLSAVVANGERIACPGVLPQAPFVIQGSSFTADLFIMPLAGFDVVLGAQWLGTLGPVTWDFTARTMSFQQQGATILWRAEAEPGSSSVCTTTASPSLLDELPASFGGVFAEPQGLPPPRSRDHGITLQPGAPPVAVRPSCAQGRA